jgi:uncharacterized protein YndB with AHSA1/START domain
MTRPAAKHPGTKPLELTVTRDIDAPRTLVWKCWTDPAHAGKWGPEGFTVLYEDRPLAVGGAWRCCLRPTDGRPDLWQGGEFREIVEPERLVMTFAWDDDLARGEPPMLLTLTFEELGDNRTRLTLHQDGFGSVESRHGHRGGWTEALAALAAHAESLAP